MTRTFLLGVLALVALAWPADVVAQGVGARSSATRWVDQLKVYFVGHGANTSSSTQGSRPEPLVPSS